MQKELVSLMGFPVVQAPEEGESQIVEMVKAKKVDGCVSQDYDSYFLGLRYNIETLGLLETKSSWKKYLCGY